MRRLLVLLPLILLVAGCFPGAQALQGALTAKAEPPVIQVQPPDVTLTLGDITVTQGAPKAEQAADDHPLQVTFENNNYSGGADNGDGAWVHGKAEDVEAFSTGRDPPDDSFGPDVIRDALGPVFKDLDERMLRIEDELSNMTK